MEGAVPWFLVGLVFFIAIFVYILFMVFLPEWVGITGKTALDNERSHLGDSPELGGIDPQIQPAISQDEVINATPDHSASNKKKLSDF
jgi:hypothetical protein